MVSLFLISSNVIICINHLSPSFVHVLPLFAILSAGPDVPRAPSAAKSVSEGPSFSGCHRYSSNIPLPGRQDMPLPGLWFRYSWAVPPAHAKDPPETASENRWHRLRRPLSEISWKCAHLPPWPGSRPRPDRQEIPRWRVPDEPASFLW